MTDVFGAVELPFQEAVSGCKPALSSDVRPSVCGWACSLQKRDSTFCLESSTPPSREKPASQVEACETGDSGKRQGVLEVHCYFHRSLTQWTWLWVNSGSW